MLSVLPEVDVAMVEDVSTDVDVVEALWGQNHAHIIPSVEEGDHLGEEINVCNLQFQQHVSNANLSYTNARQTNMRNSASCKQLHSSIAATAGHMSSSCKLLVSALLSAYPVVTQDCTDREECTKA